MTEVNQKKGIKNIKDVFYDILDDWPTESLKKTLFRLRPEEGAEVYLNLNDENYDLTEQSLEIEKKFRPKMTLRTKELKTELERWDIGGGAFFRVIGNAPNPPEATKLCVQYFILWTRQLFPFHFVFLSLPFFIATLFLWQFSALFGPGPDDSLVKYLTLLITGLLFICLGIWTYFEGLYKRFIVGIKSWKTVPDSMIGFVVPGILFWTTGLEYAIMEIAGFSNLIAFMPISAWVSLGLGIVILFIGTDFFLRGEKSYVEKFSHPMDYAPLLLFLNKNERGDWQIEGTQFDFFHYKTVFVPREKLTFTEDDIEQTHPSFLIDRSWHAFREYIKPNLMIRFFSNVITNIILWIMILGTYVVFILIKFNVAIINYTEIANIIESGEVIQLGILLLIYILLPMIIVLMVWSRSRTREYKLEMWEEMNKRDGQEFIKTHHLSFDRLRILWNLRNREHLGEQQITTLWSKSTWIEGDSSRLVTRIKLQFPFERYKDWHTLRDTQEELLSLISLATKKRESRAIRRESLPPRDELRRQMRAEIHTIEGELEHLTDEQRKKNDTQRNIEEIGTLEQNTGDTLKQQFGNNSSMDDGENLENPELPTLGEIEELPEETIEEKGEEEEEFKIPDIPIDVKKEED